MAEPKEELAVLLHLVWPFQLLRAALLAAELESL